jgi:hypothetical protein
LLLGILAWLRLRLRLRLELAGLLVLTLLLAVRWVLRRLLVRRPVLRERLRRLTGILLRGRLGRGSGHERILLLDLGQNRTPHPTHRDRSPMPSPRPGIHLVTGRFPTVTTFKETG